MTLHKINGTWLPQILVAPQVLKSLSIFQQSKFLVKKPI